MFSKSFKTLFRVKNARRMLQMSRFNFWTTESKPAKEPRKMTEGYHQTYSHDNRVNLVFKSDNQHLNMLEKHRYTTLIKFCAESLYRHYGKTTEQAIKSSDEFIELVTKNIDSRTFLIMLKHISELRKTVLDIKEHEITPQSFLNFLDKLSNMTNSDKLNEFVMRKLAETNIGLITETKLLNAYHKQSVDYQFEENSRIEEIKKFAAGVVPETRFIFDNYKVSNMNETKSLQDTTSDISKILLQDNKLNFKKKESASKDEDDDEDSGLEDNKPKSERSLDSNQNQYSEPDDYFSFFSSHEKLLLKPETNSFKHLRQFIKYLPVDYYVLLQENFNTKSEFVESPYLMFRNLPLIMKNKTNFKSYKHRHVTYEDISRCQDNEQLFEILDEESAIEELKFQMSKYGEVDKVEPLNFSKDDIMNIISSAIPRPTIDEMTEFEKTMQKIVEDGKLSQTNDPFEAVLKTHRHEFLKKLNYKATKSNVDIAEGYLNLTEEQKTEIATTVFRKGRQMKNLQKGIFINGLLKFHDYESKLKFLLSPVNKFGMKFYDQQKNIHFADADFANTLSLQSKDFENNRLQDAWDIINEVLVNSGYLSDDLWVVGKLKALNDVELKNAFVRPNTSISVRFHNFYEAKDAFYYLSQAKIKGRKRISVRYANPTTTYYDAKFATVFENVIKNKFENLDNIIEVPSNYAQIRLDEITKQKYK